MDIPKLYQCCYSINIFQIGTYSWWVIYRATFHLNTSTDVQVCWLTSHMLADFSLFPARWQKWCYIFYCISMDDVALEFLYFLYVAVSVRTRYASGYKYASRHRTSPACPNPFIYVNPEEQFVIHLICYLNCQWLCMHDMFQLYKHLCKWYSCL